MLQTRQGTLLAGTAVALLFSSPSASLAQEQVVGVPALAGGAAQVTGVLSAREATPLDRELEIRFSHAATGAPVTEFEEELTQQLHVIAVDSALSTFIHVHDEAADAEGRFQVRVPFPEAGLYHLYADATPAGLGQQVLRFDLPVGEPAEPRAASLQPQNGDLLRASDGPYTVELDASELEAGKEGQVTMRILKDGEPAADLTPYLGVPAHAVLVAADDLAYVHAHAEAQAAAAHSGQGGHAGHGMTSAAESVAPELTLHITPPAEGVYALWVQFAGGGEVRTVPFVLSVPAADAG